MDIGDDLGGALWPGMTPANAPRRDDLCAVGAKGVRIRYADGSERLDGTSGLWNVPLGYGNEAVRAAASEALRDASYLGTYQVENLFAREAAEALRTVAGPEAFARVAFATSGGSANDMVLKLVRQYHVLRNDEARNGIVALEGCWHGLTFGAFGLTSDSLGQRMYGIDRRLVLHTPPNDGAALARLLNEHGPRIGALVVEPVLGTGAIALDDSYIANLLEARRDHGVLIVADEVATGFGRTGRYFASQAWPEPPDVLITSKGLTNGTCAASAVLVSLKIASIFESAGATLAHGETQAGTSVTCAAILATISEMDRLDVPARALGLGEQLDRKLAVIVDEEPLVVRSTGNGCMRSIRLRHPDGSALDQRDVDSVMKHIRAAGANVHSAPSGIAILPALVYTANEVEELFDAIREGLRRYREASTISGDPGSISR